MRRTSKPASSVSIRTSVITMSYSCDCSLRPASAADVAESTSKRFSSNTAFRVKSTVASSSTNSTRRFILKTTSTFKKNRRPLWRGAQTTQRRTHMGCAIRPFRLAGVRCYYITVASFYVQNFGCRATQADGAAIERQFEERGLERAFAPADAEIVVLNTCTVTAAADQDARAAIRRVHRQNPLAQIVVTGCYAQRAPEELASLPGVRHVIGNSHKHRLAEIAVSSGIAGAVNADVSWEGHGFSRVVNQEMSRA